MSQYMKGIQGSVRFNFEEFDEDKVDEYLGALETTGEAAAAARAVNANPNEVAKYRRDNSWFDAFCKIAIDRHNEALIQKAKSRAFDGTPRMALGGKDRDQPIEIGTDYSDRLAELFLKRADHSFNEKQQVEVTADVNLAQMFDYRSMSQRARAKLRELLQVLKEDKAAAEHEAAMSENAAPAALSENAASSGDEPSTGLDEEPAE